MAAIIKENKKFIYAIKFQDLPFREIDKYVCVPFSWIIHRLEGQKALVAYPENEAPFVTRNRTKKREKRDSDWRYYIGFIKFKSTNYEDVVQWIEEKLANGADDQEEESVIEDSQPVVRRQLRSSKNPVLSGILTEKPRLTKKPHSYPRRPLPRMLIRPPLPLRPWKPKQIKPAVSSSNAPPKDPPVIVENRVIQIAVNHENTNDHSQQKSIDTSAQSLPQLPDERPSPVQDEQLLSKPDIGDSNVEVESDPIEEKRPPISKQTPPNPVNDIPASVTHHEYAFLESLFYEIHTGQPKEAIVTQKTSLAQNPTVGPPNTSGAIQPSQHDYAQSSASTPCSKQQQGTVGTSSEMIHSYQNSHLQDHRKTVPSTFHTPRPIDLPSQRQIPATGKKYLSAIKKPAEKTARLQKIVKKIAASQQSLCNEQIRNYAGKGDMIDYRRPLQTTDTSAAQNILNLAHQTRFYEPSQIQYLQQIERMMISRPNIPYIDQKSYRPNVMAGGHVSQNQPSQINQLSKLYIDQRSYLPNFMAGGHVSQNKPSQINQPSQYVDQRSYLPNVIAGGHVSQNQPSQINQPSQSYIDQRSYLQNVMAGGHVSQNQPSQINQLSQSHIDQRSYLPNVMAGGHVSQNKPSQINQPSQSYIDQRSYLQNVMAEGHVSQNQPSQINQPSQYIDQRSYLPDVLAEGHVSQNQPSQINQPSQLYIDQRSYLPNVMAGGHVSQNQPSQINQPSPFYIDQRSYLPNFMAGGHVSQNQPSQINQPSQLLMDQRSYLTNIMAGGYVSQNQPSQINQPSQFLLRPNQRPIVHAKQMPKLMRHELSAPPLAAQNQQASNLENLQKQDSLTDNSLETRSISGNPKLQVTAERPVALSKTNQQLSNDQKSNSRKDLLAKLSRCPTAHLEICVAAPENAQDSENQTTSESQETRPKQVPEKNIHQHSESKKMVADQATEIESTIENQCKDEIFASSLESMDSRYETNKLLTKVQGSPQEVPDSEMVSVDEELLENVSTDCENDDYSEEDTSACTTDVRSVDGRNLIAETQQKLSTMAEQEILEIHDLLLTKMHKSFLDTDEFYNKLRVNNLGCLKLYETLLNKIEKDNIIEPLQTPTSKATEITQVPQETPVQVSEQVSNDDHNNPSVKNSPAKTKQRLAFVLPPEYDPNDSRWTLKHREPGPGLTELMPQSRIYVNKAEYQNCIRASNDSRALARSLLTAVFSKNALSVCSLTGGKARAFGTMEIDVRPGLDENARLVLLAFIEEYGNARNWNTSDRVGIMSSIRTKIQEIRNKCGKKKVV